MSGSRSISYCRSVSPFSYYDSFSTHEPNCSAAVLLNSLLATFNVRRDLRESTAGATSDHYWRNHSKSSVRMLQLTRMEPEPDQVDLHHMQWVTR